jgi:hypothetical protein
MGRLRRWQAVAVVVMAVVVIECVPLCECQEEPDTSARGVLVGFSIDGGLVPPDPAPADAPPTIRSEQELAELGGGRWVAPVMYGGLG